HDENNEVIGFTKVTRDLTLYKLSEDALRENTEILRQRNEALEQQKEFIETVLDASVNLITVYDAEMRVMTMNKQTEKLLGVKRETIIGKKYIELFPNT